MKITFTLNLDGDEIAETMEFDEVALERNELEAKYRCWANEQFVRKTGGSEACYFKLSNVTVSKGSD